MLFFWSFEEFWKKYITKTLISTTFSIALNVSWTANQLIIKISEGSRDTEDWSNDAYITLHFKIHSNRNHLLLIVIIFHNISFYYVSDQIYTDTDEHKILFFSSVQSNAL